MTRTATLNRSTNETAINGRIDLDGRGVSTIATGLGFLDHMIVTLTKHTGFDLELNAVGDTVVDDQFYHFAHIIRFAGVIRHDVIQLFLCAQPVIRCSDERRVLHVVLRDIG